MSKIEDLAQVLVGKSYSLSSKESGYLYFTLENIQEYGIIENKSQKYVKDKDADTNAALEYGDILIFTNREGKYQIIHFRPEDGSIFADKKVLPSKDFIYLKEPVGYLSNYLSTTRCYRKLLEHLNGKSKNLLESFELIKDFQVEAENLDDELAVEEAIDENSSEGSQENQNHFPNARVETASFSIHQILEMIENQEIDFKTPFQRKAYLWKEDKMAKLIESILMGIPIPAFYLDRIEYDNYLIIDGLQRLSSIKKFRDGELALKDLDYLKQFQNQKWSELENKYKRRIEQYQLTVYIVHPDTDKSIKYNLFKRINTGALELSHQEVRHALNQGQPADLLKKFSELSEFKKYINLSTPLIDRMEDREIVLRYFAFQLTDYRNYKGEGIHTFLDRSMEEMDNLKHDRVTNLEGNFRHSLKVAHKIFREHIFKRSIADDKPKNRRFSKILFETWMYVLAKLSTEERNQLLREEGYKRRQKIRRVFRSWMKGQPIAEETQDEFDFDDLINQRPYTKKRLHARFERIEGLIELSKNI